MKIDRRQRFAEAKSKVVGVDTPHKFEGVPVSEVVQRVEAIIAEERQQKSRSVEKERDTLSRYTEGIFTRYNGHLEKYLDVMQPMHPDCRVSVTMPAFLEEEGMYQALMAYADQKSLATGERLDRNMFEINVLVNREKSQPSDRTYAEAMRFKDLYADLHLNVLEAEFPDGRGGVGLARQLVTDLAIVRSLERSEQQGALYLQSEDADLIEADDFTIDNIITRFDESPHLDLLAGQLDQSPEQMMRNEVVFLTQRIREIGRLLARDAKCDPFEMFKQGKPWTFDGGRILSRGCNTAFTAQVFAEISGYNSKDTLGEDLHIGKMISFLRGFKLDGVWVPTMRTLGTSPSRNQYSPRRVFDSALQPLYRHYGTLEKEVGVRRSLEDTIARVNETIGEELSEANVWVINQSLQQAYANIRKAVPEEFREKHFNRLLSMLGFQKEDVEVNQYRHRDPKTQQSTGASVNIRVVNLDNVKQSLAKYKVRRQPKEEKILVS